jgi:hypothetical protein
VALEMDNFYANIFMAVWTILGPFGTQNYQMAINYYGRLVIF